VEKVKRAVCGVLHNALKGKWKVHSTYTMLLCLVHHTTNYLHLHMKLFDCLDFVFCVPKSLGEVEVELLFVATKSTGLRLHTSVIILTELNGLKKKACNQLAAL